MALNTAQSIAVCGGVVYVVQLVFFTVYSMYNKRRKATSLIEDSMDSVTVKSADEDKTVDLESDKEREITAHSEWQMFSELDEQNRDQGSPPPYCEKAARRSAEDTGSDGPPHFSDCVKTSQEEHVTSLQ